MGVSVLTTVLKPLHKHRLESGCKLWDLLHTNRASKTDVTAMDVVWMISGSSFFRGNESVTRLS